VAQKKTSVGGIKFVKGALGHWRRDKSRKMNPAPSFADVLAMSVFFQRA
jgi:hypothetical protein